MRPRILSGPWAVGLSIYVFISIYTILYLRVHISIYIYVDEYLNIYLHLYTYLHLRIYNSIFTMDKRSDSAALAAWSSGYERWYVEVSVL